MGWIKRKQGCRTGPILQNLSTRAVLYKCTWLGVLFSMGNFFQKFFLTIPLCIMMEISLSLSCKEFSMNGRRSLEDCHRYYTFNLIILHVKTKIIYCFHIFTC